MNLIAKIAVCDRADLIVMDFEVVPEFPCGHPRTESNTYVYQRRDGNVYKWCKRCRADSERRRWQSKRDGR